MEHRPLKRRRTSSINDHDDPCRKRQKLLASVFKQLQQTAEEVRCALNDATWLSVEERVVVALAIDHVAGMSMMMEESYELGDGEMEVDDGEEMEEDNEERSEYGDEHENVDNAGDVVEEVANDDSESPFVRGGTGFSEGEDKIEGGGREEGGDEDEDGDGEEEVEDSYSSWIKRGVSFSAGTLCTAYNESGGS